MSTHTPDKPAVSVPLAPASKGQPDVNVIADDSGRAIIALLHKAAKNAKNDCGRAMDLAHKLSSHLRPRKSGRESLRYRPHVNAIARRPRRNGCCASTKRLSIRFKVFLDQSGRIRQTTVLSVSPAFKRRLATAARCAEPSSGTLGHLIRT
jgi:hypothetical protein